MSEAVDCEHDLKSVEDNDLPYYCWFYRCRKCGVECSNPSELEPSAREYVNHSSTKEK